MRSRNRYEEASRTLRGSFKSTRVTNKQAVTCKLAGISTNGTISLGIATAGGLGDIVPAMIVPPATLPWLPPTEPPVQY